MLASRVLWINTGGTIVSKAYDPSKPPAHVEPLPLAQSTELMCELFSRITHGRNHIDGCSLIGQQERFQKDSKLFVPEDIAHLADMIAADNEHSTFLITHGTDQMTDNARDLKAELAKRGVNGRTIIFTGAMVPLSMGKGDAQDNIEFALDSMGMKEGVYVVARSRAGRHACWDPDKMKKDMDASREAKRFTVMNR